MSSPAETLEEQLRRQALALKAGVKQLKEESEARKQAEEAQREVAERFRTVLREIDDVVWASSGDGSEMSYINSACEQIYGRPTAEFLANPNLWLEVIHPEDLERVQEGLNDFFERGSIEQQYRIVRPDGQVRWLSDRKYVVFDEAGNQTRMGGIATDITEQVKTRVEREAFVKQLEAKNAELERFTYTVSHDLKAPLVTIGGFLRELEKDVERGDSERIRQDIDFISAAVRRMHDLLTDLLELSRIGRLAGTPESIPMSDLAREAVQLVTGPLESKPFEIEVEPEMPTVWGDRARLLEVYQNLIENAVKFLGDQTDARVEIGARPEDGEVVFFVRDNGRGIDARYQEKIFGLFQQLDARAEGSGIGLSLIKRIVEVHGGRIWVESAGTGHGSTFCFTLPTAEASKDRP